MNGSEYEAAPEGGRPSDIDSDDAEEGGKLTQRAGDILQRGREYLDAMDPAELRADVEDTIRSRPILSVCIAALAGFVVGRMIRD